MSIKEESVFVSSQEEDEVVKEEINNKHQEVSKKSKKNVEKMKKKFEKENKIQVIKEPEPEPEVIKEPELIKEPQVKLEEIKIEETIQDIKEVIKEASADISNNIILPDFSNKSITEIFLYIKQKYEDNKDVKNEKENNEINNYYKKINYVLTYDDIVIINKLLKSDPTIFNEIEKLAQDIIKNGDNDGENMPHLISIIKILYGKIVFTKELTLDTKNISTICVNIIKFIFHSLLDKSENNLLNLTHLDQIIETCIFLLDNRHVVNTASCCSIM